MKLENLREMTTKEMRELSNDELIDLVSNLSEEDIIEVSKLYSYPIYLRKLLGSLQHKAVIFQPGSAAFITNEKGEILLHSRADRDMWGVPGGCQELTETFEETIIREIKEELNLDIKEEDLNLFAVVSGKTRKNSYPNGDVVYSNTVLYEVKNYSGNIKINNESRKVEWFSIDNIPTNHVDDDLIKEYIKYAKDNK